MSVVSSVLSTRSSAWKINARVASLMDSIFAIGFGLGLRFVVDAVSHHDFKLTGTLVGLWEGIILLHFLKKMPKSTDPYIAYGVRLFVDFLCTESVARLVLVLIWTGMGMVLADITPALWDDVGLNRIWRRFRRDIYTISQMIPTVAFFPPPRTVRFSPSREHSIIPEEPSVLDLQPPSTITTTEQTPTTLNTAPAITTSTAPVARELLRRRVPGYFPEDYSDTDTDLGSIRAAPLPGRTSRRLSVYPQHDYDDSITDLSSNNDLDEGNLSSGASSVSTPRGGPSSITFDTAVIPDIEDEVEEELLVDTAAVPAKDEEERTPRQAPMYLPPTPSDSAVRWHRNIEPEEPLPVRSFSSLPQIPDFLDESMPEGLDKIQSQEAAEEKPPTPPAKDDLPSRFIPPVPTRPPPQPTRSPDESWEILKAEFVVPESTATTNDNRQSLPPSYRENEEFDDIYGDEYAAPTTNTTAMTHDFNDKGKGVDLGAQTSLIDDGIASPLGAPFTFKFDPNSAATPWNVGPSAGVDLAEIARREEEQVVEVAAAAEAAEAEALQKQEEEWAAAEAEAAEAAAQKEADEAAEKKRKDEEAAEQEQLKKEEEERKRKEEEKAERKRKEEADGFARQQKRAEEEAAAKNKAEEEAAKRKAEEEATRKAEEKQRKAEEKQRKLEEKAEKRKKEEAKEAKKAELAEAANVAAEAEAKKQAEAAAQRKKDANEAAARRENARQEKEEKEKREQEAAAREAEEKRKQQEQEEQRKKEEFAKAKAEEDATAAAAAALEDKRRQEEQDAAVAAAVATALEEEKRQQEEQKAKEKSEEAKEVQTGGEPSHHEVPAATTSEEGPTSSPDTQQAPETNPAQRDLPPTPSSSESANVQAGDTTVVPEGPAQAEESGELPVDAADAESVVTDASEMPADVGVRLQRLILAKAQMIEVQDRIEELKQKLEAPEEDRASISEQLKVSEKILKKMARKEQRRYEEGGAAHYLLDSSFDLPDSISYGTLNPKDVGLKTEEKLEELMWPGANSLSVTLTAGKKNPGLKQKTKLIEILEDYNLFSYTTEDAKNGRILNVNLSEQQFRQWLLKYRADITSSREDDW